IPEVDQTRIGASTEELRLLGISQYPNADAIAVRRPARLLAQIQRVVITRLATILDIHAEQASARFAATLFALPVTHAGEGNLVGRRAARLRSRETVSRIADPIRYRPGAIVTIRVQVR